MNGSNYVGATLAVALDAIDPDAIDHNTVAGVVTAAGAGASPAPTGEFYNFISFYCKCRLQVLYCWLILPAMWKNFISGYLVFTKKERTGILVLLRDAAELEALEDEAADRGGCPVRDRAVGLVVGIERERAAGMERHLERRPPRAQLRRRRQGRARVRTQDLHDVGHGGHGGPGVVAGRHRDGERHARGLRQGCAGLAGRRSGGRGLARQQDLQARVRSRDGGAREGGQQERRASHREYEATRVGHDRSSPVNSGRAAASGIARATRRDWDARGVIGSAPLATDLQPAWMPGAIRGRPLHGPCPGAAARGLAPQPAVESTWVEEPGTCVFARGHGALPCFEEIVRSVTRAFSRDARTRRATCSAGPRSA